MPKKKKIVIGSVEVVGIIKTLSSALRELGHQVTTIASMDDSGFYQYEYDLNPDNLIYSYFKFKIKSRFLAQLITKYLSVFGKSINNKIRDKITEKIFLGVDVYIFVWKTVLQEDEQLLSYLKKKEIKIVSLFLGSDIRDYPAFKQKFNIIHWDFSDELNLPGTEAKKKKLALHEKYSDVIFSVPDQSIFAKRSYFHLQVPMQIQKFSRIIPNNEIPVVLHAPSKPELKGTDLILQTLEELKSEGVKFELKLIKGIPHTQLLEELKKTDVLIDEIVLHGPGFLSFEAMLNGCAVATKYYENSPSCFRPPVFSIDEYNIKERLRELLGNRSLITELAVKGQEYAVKNNDSLIVAENILKSINSNKFDYVIN